MLKKIITLLCLSWFLLLVGCASLSNQNTTCVYNKKYGRKMCYKQYGKQYQVLGSSKNYEEKGVASWYGRGFQKKRTSSGERYNMYSLTAAHKTLPLHTRVRVTNLSNGRSVVVRINDRGPFISNRLIDVSYAAAKQLHMVGQGTTPVDVKAI